MSDDTYTCVLCDGIGCEHCNYTGGDVTIYSESTRGENERVPKEDDCKEPFYPKEKERGSNGFKKM